jgi:hypothetical protein
MGNWTTADPHDCCETPLPGDGPTEKHGRRVYAYAPCEHCGATDRDVFLDGHYSQYETNGERAVDSETHLPTAVDPVSLEYPDGTELDWPADLEAHDWSAWRFENEGERIDAFRSCPCGITHERRFVYRYTERQA